MDSKATLLCTIFSYQKLCYYLNGHPVCTSLGRVLTVGAVESVRKPNWICCVQGRHLTHGTIFLACIWSQLLKHFDTQRCSRSFCSIFPLFIYSSKALWIFSFTATPLMFPHVYVGNRISPTLYSVDKEVGKSSFSQRMGPRSGLGKIRLKFEQNDIKREKNWWIITCLEDRLSCFSLYRPVLSHFQLIVGTAISFQCILFYSSA